MKKTLFLLMACLILICSVAAASTPDGYPAVRIDPNTGKPYDLGGQTVYILDYWSGEGGRWSDPPPDRQAQYDYQDWLMETYNCTIVQKQAGDWSTCAEEMINFASAPDGSLRLYFIEPGKVGTLISNGLAANWKLSTSIDLAEDYWNQATMDMCTLGDSVYGASVGASEPRGLLFFNKRLLEEAGVNWNNIYDMQASGTWTWDAWEEILVQTTRDTDNDGVIDVWGVGGSGDDLYLLAPFSAGGTFFDFDAYGKLQPTADSGITTDALNWAQYIQRTYWDPQPEGASWDWYKDAWLNGEFAFYVFQSYAGFYDSSEMSGMEDEWGAVAFPVPNAGDPYVTVASENTALIPNVYTADEISKISLIFDLWHRPTPGYDDEFSWIGNKYNFTDDRAVDETYAMLRENDHTRGNKASLLGTQADVLGMPLFWALPDGNVSELIEDAMPAWQELCDYVNNQLALGTPYPSEYPPIRIDPNTGKPYDLGGQTVYIMDYWSGDGKRDSSPSKEQQALYDYQDWLMEIYNCKIVQKQAGDWGTCAEEMINFTAAPDGSLRAYIIEPGKVGTLVQNGIAANWNRSTTIDLSDEHWNQATVDLLTMGSRVYGVSTSNSEPREMLFFNKRLLEEAGIDWVTIYNMQANGTWTWDAWEKLLQKTTRDTDGDGVIDVWGVSGNPDNMYALAVFSNGGSFFDFDADGKLQPTMDSSKAVDALTWGQSIQSKYWKLTPEGANWDWYKDAWVNGEFAFYVYPAFGGFNDNSEMAAMEDEWGAVAFPTKRKGAEYVTIVSENTAMIPNVYSTEQISMITMIYDLWTQPNPTYNDPFSWIGNKYNFTDDRAVDETYAMLREHEHTRTNKVTLLGTQNDVLGSSLLWALPDGDISTLISDGMPAWQALCDSFNHEMRAPASKPADYPEIRLDPLTGEPYDLGGRTVYIMDYWSGDGSRDSTPTEEQQAMYDYQDWLMETYNCTIVQKQGGDWSTCATEMINFTTAPDGSLRVYIIEPGKAGSLVSNGIAADWNQSSTINLKDDHWNSSTVNLMSMGSSVYGVSTGKSEPRTVVFFNKRLLNEAGIDWNTIYNMQANGTWTWDAWEKLLKKATRDTNNDGVIDVWGVGGASDDMYILATFSNGGSFFDFDDEGKMLPTMDSAAALEALNWGAHIQNNYWMFPYDGANWDWYKQAWLDGNFAFYVYPAFGGFSEYSEMATMEDEWGCVAFPTKEQGGKYITVVSENSALIPNVYTAEEISMISLIYDLWTQPTPGYDDDFAWIGNKYNFTDDRAVDETYAMLRENKHTRADKVTLLGQQNDILGSSLLWSLPGGSPADLIEAALPEWQALCSSFNTKTAARRVPLVSVDGLDTLNLPKFMVSIGAESFARTGTQAIVLPAGCSSIGSRAFYGAPVLEYVVVPASVKTIASDAFAGFASGTKVVVQAESYAARFCSVNGIPFVVVSDEAMDMLTSQVW